MELYLISKGKFFWPNGNSYEGDFKNDFRDGLGVYKLKNGERHEGEWKNGKKNGKGILKNGIYVWTQKLINN